MPVPGTSAEAPVPLLPFSPVPARLSPAKAGRLSVPRPDCLSLDDGGFAFHLHDDCPAPALGAGHLAYASWSRVPYRGSLMLAGTP